MTGIEVTGLDDVLRGLDAAEADAMGVAVGEIHETVTGMGADLERTAPRRSGHLASSIAVNHTKRGGSVMVSARYARAVESRLSKLRRWWIGAVQTPAVGGLVERIAGKLRQRYGAAHVRVERGE